MDAFSLSYSDDSKKKTFHNGGSNRHGLKTLGVNRPQNLWQKGRTNTSKRKSDIPRIASQG